MSLYVAMVAVSGIGALIYNVPTRDRKTGKRLFKKRTVINEIIRSFLFTMRKSKLILSMVSSAWLPAGHLLSGKGGPGLLKHGLPVRSSLRGFLFSGKGT